MHTGYLRNSSRSGAASPRLFFFPRRSESIVVASQRVPEGYMKPASISLWKNGLPIVADQRPRAGMTSFVSWGPSSKGRSPRGKRLQPQVCRNSGVTMSRWKKQGDEIGLDAAVHRIPSGFSTRVLA